MRERKNRLIRWIIIAASALFLFPLYYPSPWSPESAVSDTLEGMGFPSASVEAISVIQAGNMYAVLFYDDKLGLSYHFLLDRPFGFLWRNRGGGGGYPFDPESVLKWGWGGHRERNGSWYTYASGQVNDPQIHSLTVEWSDGETQSMRPIKGFYHFARVFSPEEGASAILLAYDENGKLLYRLDENQREIRKPAAP
ncbi:hypothetical protein NDK47_18035 [Brevibacillus ruminantium]|uniref:Uncharacterized protein n=1 Tax=Brevibacillus ruminantium TaxID=2950604 RepID=A0ABY4WA41_9BACL|nr:hypothetical protein [Brevibacillus ruminantium]USG64048.1 hypothetical protein NDK47_18035 [Brevibacillus ruminantium]